jgi:hypothetical protein
MSVNFFEIGCQEQPITAQIFGICDKKNEKAFTKLQEPKTWIATVENLNLISITFTAIDGCIKILRDDGSTEKRCDCMLTYTDNIVFVELKEVEKSWTTEAIKQLEITIKQFIAEHDISVYRHKRAFACNRKHPRFQVIEPSLKKRFFDTYRVRLNIQGLIKIR